MRLHPKVTKGEALAWLRAQAAASWGPARAAELEAGLEQLAEAMAAVSAVELPDDLEPFFP